MDAFTEIHVGASVAIIHGGAEVPLGSGYTLKTATEQVKLLCQIVWVILVVLVPLRKEFCLEVGYGVSQRAYSGPKMPLSSTMSQDIFCPL